MNFAANLLDYQAQNMFFPLRFVHKQIHNNYILQRLEQHIIMQSCGKLKAESNFRELHDQT